MTVHIFFRERAQSLNRSARERGTRPPVSACAGGYTRYSSACRVAGDLGGVCFVVFQYDSMKSNEGCPPLWMLSVPHSPTRSSR